MTANPILSAADFAKILNNVLEGDPNAKIQISLDEAKTYDAINFINKDDIRIWVEEGQPTIVDIDFFSSPKVG